MAGKLIKAIDNAINRRAFLRKATAVGGSLVAGVFGVAPPAQACFSCCFLCKDPTTCLFVGCVCIWSWECMDQFACRNYRCDECYNNAVSCVGGCNGVYCSRYVFTVTMPDCVPNHT